MGIFDWFKPLDKAIDIVDKLVIDKDRSIVLKAELQKAQLELRAMAEQTYRAELDSKTIPWVDALHKMGRQILSLLNLIIPPIVLLTLGVLDQPLTDKHMLILGIGSGASIVYNGVKGKGNSE